MTETNVTTMRKPLDLPKWQTNAKGQKRGLNGTWNKVRAAELLESSPKRWFDIHELARSIYGYATKTNQTLVRRHIPVQRQFMLNRDCPIVTEYGARGELVAIKCFDSTYEEDKVKLGVELRKQHERNEINTQRYEQLLQHYLLTDQRVTDQLNERA